ncbi:hypothetical protein Pmar_PMAR023922, partial [Perkinsus marinus ATCC 50983]
MPLQRSSFDVSSFLAGLGLATGAAVALTLGISRYSRSSRERRLLDSALEKGKAATKIKDEVEKDDV